MEHEITLDIHPSLKNQEALVILVHDRTCYTKVIDKKDVDKFHQLIDSVDGLDV